MSSSKKNMKTNGMAIVGVACRFPGAENYEHFWSNLSNGTNSIKEIPLDRWDIKEYYSKDIKEPNKSVSKWCGIVEKVNEFDNRFFNISPREASNMDPQQRLLLEETWRCIEDSGIHLDKLQQKKTSVYIGAMAVDYRQKALEAEVDTDSYACLGNYECILANRVSYLFGFQGVSSSINAACASSLVAIHQAKQSLQRGESDYAFVGGVNLNLHPWKYISFSKSRMLSPEGQCKTFDKDANGYVPGDGVGVLLLQRLEDAISEGQRIYGVIKGSAVNHVGKSLSITAPSIKSQKKVIMDAYNDAGFTPETVSYVEAHGTGTSLGDPIEVEALKQVFSEYTDRKHFCKIGSVKTNIGHLEAAAGIAGVIKVLMMMNYKKIPKSLNVQTTNPILNLENSPFLLASQYTDWENENSQLLRAGVSSFGFGGVNSHVLLEEYSDDTSDLLDNEDNENYPFVLSAKTESSLEKQLMKWKSFVESDGFKNYKLKDICLTLLNGRKCFNYRYGKVITSKDELIELISVPSNSIFKKVENPWLLRIGNKLCYGYKEVENLIDKCFLYRENLNIILDELKKVEGGQTLYADFQKTIWDEPYVNLYSFIVSYAFNKTIIKLGFSPNLVTGEKLGVWVGLTLAGILTLRDTISLLLGKKDLKQIVFSRPRISYYDTYRNQILKPFYFDKKYIQKLLQGVREEVFSSKICVENDSFKSIQDDTILFHYYIKKAQLLINSQFTFKKYIEQWKEVAKANYKEDIFDILYNNKDEFNDQQINNTDKLLLTVAIVSSLHKLHQKWDIKELEIKQYLKLFELVDLIVDEVLTLEEFIYLLGNKGKSYEYVANLLNERQDKMNLESSYRYIRKYNSSIREISETSKWVENLINNITSPMNNINSIQSLEVGDLSNSAKGAVQFKWDEIEDLDKQIKQSFLKLWIMGTDIKWPELWKLNNYQTVKLPGYCFEKKSFSFPQKRKKELLSSLLVSSEQKIIREHNIAGHTIMPFASMIDRTLNLLEKRYSIPITLNNVTVHKPVVVENKTTLQITINEEKNRFKISSELGTIFSGNYKAAKYKNFTPTEFQNDFFEYSWNLEELYSKLSKIGYRYGENLKTIQKASEIKDRYLFKIGKFSDFNKYSTAINPALLDGVFQTLLMIECQKGTLSQNDRHLYVPYSIKSMSIFGNLNDSCYLSIEKQDIKREENNLYVSMHVYDQNGNEIVVISDMLFKKVTNRFLEKYDLIQDDACTMSDQIYYQPVWVKQNSINLRQDKLNKVAIIFINEDKLSTELYKQLFEKYQKLFFVKKSSNFKVKDNGFEINIEQESNYHEVIQCILNETETKSVEYDVYHLWSYEKDFKPLTLQDVLDYRQGISLKSLLFLTKAFTKAQVKKKINIVTCTIGSQVVKGTDYGNGFMYGGIAGLAKSAMLENRNILMKIIDYDDNLSEVDQATNLVMEMDSVSSSVETLIAYRNRSRYIYKIESNYFTNELRSATFKNNYVYIITGGSGEVGLKIVKKITEQAKAKIILLGKSNLNAKKIKCIESLKSNGSEITYYQCDVSNEEQTKEIIEKIKDQYGHINGVIHAAGLLNDELLINKGWKSFKKVIAPKVQGTYIINKLTESEPLDFFVVFSSIVSITGNIGQVDYATANSFLDTFIDYRKQNNYPGKSISINWTLWDDGGMGNASHVIKTFLRRSGIINSKQALILLEYILQGQGNQYLIVGDSTVFEENFGKEGIIKKNMDTLNYAQENEKNRDLGIIQNFLIKALGKVLGVDPEEIELDTDIREYGLESISLSEFADYINEEFDLSLNPIVMFDYPKIEDLTKYIIKQLQNHRDLNINTSSIEDVKDSDISILTSSKHYDDIKRLSTLLTEILAELLSIDINEIDIDTDLREFGLDSITLVEYTDTINTKWTIDINPTLLYQHTTIKEISMYLSKNHSSELDVYFNNTFKSIPNSSGKEINYSKENFDDSNLKDEHIKSSNSNKDIAIIGISGRFPGSSTPSELWDNLVEGKDLITEIPSDRWDWKEYIGDPLGEEDKTNSKWGGFLKDIKSFDADFFKISPREAELMDPQQRILIEEVWNTIEDAGYKPSSISNTNTGVFVGVCNDDYSDLMIKNNLRMDAYTSTGSYFSIIPNRISYILNIHGPSVAIDTACSSSLIAIHQAISAIQNGDCSMAFAGGINVCSSPRQYISFSNAGMLSEDGRCKTFDKSANGYVRGEGVGVIFLKSLTQAIEDGDQIYGVIKGSAVNHGGYANTLTAPNPNAQTDLIINAWEKAQIDPTTITYIETHGTGTKLGDPIEINGLKNACHQLYKKWGKSIANQPYCGLGSLKTNIGHLEAAAGIAGIIKILLAMKYKKIPGNLHFKELNPHIEIENSPFFIVNKTIDWNTENKNPNTPLRAAVSSFGFGGANAHIVLEEYKEPKDVRIYKDEKQIFIISAKDEERLKVYAENILSYLEDNKENQMKHVTLADIAYTLQVGREEMEQRLAIVASTKRELLSKLKLYIDNESKSISFYKGNTQVNKSLPNNLLKGKAGEEFFKNLLVNKDFDQLAYLWVLGFKFDWKKLYKGSMPKRISLPTYPFKKEQYWLPDSSRELAIFKEGEQDKIHPLVHKNISKLLRPEFKTIFSGDEFFLADHFVGKQKVLPGVAFIEAACIAAETASEKKVSRLSNVIWTNPIISDETQKEIFIKLTPNQSELDYEITSMNQNDEHILHGQGKISFKGSSEFLDKKEFVNINEVKERCNGLLLGDELYPKLDDLGLSLGKSFRAIEELRYSSNEALSFLSLPSHLLKDYKKFKLHPSIMDAALQTALGLLNKNNELDVLKIPFSIGEVQILGDIPHHCYSYVVKDKDSDSKQSINKFIVYILDLEGRVRVKIKDFVVRPFQQHRLTINNNTILEKSSTSYFRTVWEKYNPENLTNEGLEGNILLFGKSTDLYHRLTEKISKESKFKVILVRPGHGYCKLDNMYEINPDNKEDYKRLIDDLINSHIMPHKIIHMWSEQLFIQNGEHVNQQLAEGLFSLLYLSKALNENKSEKKIEIIYAFNGRNDQQPLYAAVSGFAKTLRLENPKLQLKTVDLQNSPYDISITKLIDILLQRNFMKDENILEIKCKGDEFLVKKRKETNVIEPDDTSTLLKNNGVYLITGGAGGLGLVIAKYLAQKIQANIILCGRSELDVDKKEKIEKIKILGSKVSYIKCDISNYDEVERLITKIKSKFNKINGVIHSAGIIRDSLIDNKTISEMKEVLAPKVLGAINLDNALKDDEIDFFVLFSSITALFGNIGQSDYAYANSFLDNFSSFRDYKKNKKERYGKTISINWPYWSEGGMSMDAHTQELLDNIMGLKAMTTETGLQAFNQAILSNEKQLVVIEGNKDKIQRNSELLFGSSKEPLDPNTDFIVEREILNQVDKLEKLDGALAFEIGNNDIDNDMVLEKLQHDLVKQVSVLLKMTEKNIDVKKDFNNYGFDSISFIKLSNNINKKYNLDITPASFFEYSNLESFSLYLFDAYGEKFVNHYQKSMETEKVSLEITNDSNREKYFNLDKNHEEINEAETIETTMSKEPIAIVGIGGKMPQSVNLEDFWGNLIKGKDLITEIPSDRWNWKDYYGDPIKENNKTNVIRGGFIKDADKFDAEFFNISSIEAKLMDPQQRIFLETVWETIENAGYQASQLSGTKTGLFVGVSTSDYLELLKENNVDIKAYTTTGSFHSILANRISYLLNLKGPSVPVDTACSSSLVALRQAMEAIWSGSCEMAIVGGVNLMFTPTISISFSKAGMLSTDGKCKTFDKDANGYVRAEGAGAIMLKPLSKAIADRDQVHAVIKGCTINHGGRVNSLTTPNPNAQAELIANTLEDAQVDPSTLSYIEMHGTGTALGDPIEINGIKKAFKDLSDKKGIKFEENPHCGIGSVKSNIGHLEAGAGMAGLLKVILSMKYKKIPGNIHLKEINPYIKLEDSPFYIVKDTIDWHRLKDQDNNEIPRRAGVSSFGFGGVNAHVVLEEYTNFPSDEIEEDLNSQVFVLSAKNEERLKEYAKNMSSFLKKTNHKGLKEICYTLQTGREAMEERLAIVVSSMEELIRKLEGYYLNNDETDIYRGHVNKGKTNHGKERNLEEKFVQDYSNSHGLYNLAQMWVTGNDIKWGVLHGEYIPKKLSLPTYPFKKKKYWMQTSTEINGEKNRSVTENQLGNENREKCSTNIGINNLNNMRANPQKEENLKLDKLFYTSVWAPKSTSVPKIGGASFLNFQRNKVLVVYSSQSLGMKDTLKKVHENDDFVSLDLKTDLRDPDEWIKKIGKLDIIYFLGGILTDVNELNDINMIENMQEQGVISLFRLVKSLIKFGYDHYSLKLKAFTNDVHKILPNESIKPYAAGINGLIKTISNEFSRWEVSCIDFCTEDIVNVKKDNSILIEHLLNELIDPSGGEVAIRGSKRYIRKISPITLPEVKHSPFRNQGVYLILGGAGGIGLEISHYLSRTVQAKLVLIGRSELNPRQKEKIKEIESLGGKVKYIQADALDIVSMNEAVRKGESEFGNINGVIHSAIVLNDKTLRNMEEEEFHSALEPKVQGSAILHHVLQEKALDFMMFFSSVQSFIGNEGQSNYAAACTFKDAYANYLSQKEQYPVKTINWGYWGSVGVVASEEYQKLMEDQGIYSIEPMEGIEAIQRVLDNNSQQIITIKAESKVLEDMGCDFGQQLELYPECMPSIFEETVGKLKNFIK